MKQIRHIGIIVDDLEAMKSFYCNQFDMRVYVHDMEVGDYIAGLYDLKMEQIQVELYKLITNDGCMIELLKVVPDSLKDMHSDRVFFKGCTHVAFTVSDVQLLYEKLSRGGIKFNSPPLLSRDQKHKVCFCRDPEGNYLELVQEL